MQLSPKLVSKNRLQTLKRFDSGTLLQMLCQRRPSFGNLFL